MMNYNFCSVTLILADIWLSHKLSQLYKQYPCSILSLFVVLYEIRYDLHIFFLLLQTFHDYRPIQYIELQYAKKDPTQHMNGNDVLKILRGEMSFI